MSTLTVESLRQRIVDLFYNELQNENSALTKTIINRINKITNDAIAEDNENDINWDETDELFGVWAPNTTPIPSTTGPIMPTTMPPMYISAFDGSVVSGQDFIVFEGKGNDQAPADKMVIRNLPSNSVSLTFDNPKILVYSDNFDWKYTLYNGTSSVVNKGVKIEFSSGELYNVTIKILYESTTPPPTNGSTPVTTDGSTPSTTVTPTPTSTLICEGTAFPT